MRIHLASLTIAGLLLSFVSAAHAQTEPKASDVIKRTSDGKPDFSGFWRGHVDKGYQRNEKSAYQGGDARPIPTRAQTAKQLPLTPKGQELLADNLKDDGQFGGEHVAPGQPGYHNVPCGVNSPGELTGDVEIVQNPKRLLMVYTGAELKWVRMVWIGRKHPKDLTDYEPAWMGHSVAEWDGDTLVVDTVRIKTEPGEMIDHMAGAPQGPNFHMIERISMAPDGKLHIAKTFEDPDLYTHPWVKNAVLTKQTDWDDLADEWEIQDPHMVCEGGRYPSDNDVFIQGPPKN